MKNKRILIVVGVVVLLALSAFAYFKFNPNKAENNGQPTSSKSIFSSVKDALSKNITLVCEFKDDKGQSVKSYIKNGAVRVTSAGLEEGNQAGDIIIKDKKMYIWDGKTKQGFVYETKDEDTSNQNVGMTAGEVVKSDSYLNMIEKYKDSCKVSTVEDSYFVPPTDVKFQDMTKFLEDIKNQMPSIPQN